MSSTSKTYPVYPVGTPGTAWGDAERSEWLQRQTKKRDFVADVVTPLRQMFADEKNELSSVAEIVEYGTVDYSARGLGTFTLVAVKSKTINTALPTILVTGGVHGYETSGVHGTLLFVKTQLVTSIRKGVNVLVLPCVTPWAYETINRWNPDALDPNRNFIAGTKCQETHFAMECIGKYTAGTRLLMHTDLHETTDTDNSEFTPAKTARDGAPPPAWEDIPDGFYLVGDSERPEPEWHKTIIDAVKLVTHIADPDENGHIIGEPLTQAGVVVVPGKSLGLCGGYTNAKFATTTEVYPDSKRTNPEECNRAQVAVITSGLEYALQHL